MSIVSDAFEDLFQEKNIEDYNFNVKYTNRFKPYNANVRLGDSRFVQINVRWNRARVDRLRQSFNDGKAATETSARTRRPR